MSHKINFLTLYFANTLTHVDRIDTETESSWPKTNCGKSLESRANPSSQLITLIYTVFIRIYISSV